MAPKRKAQDAPPAAQAGAGIGRAAAPESSGSEVRRARLCCAGGARCARRASQLARRPQDLVSCSEDGSSESSSGEGEGEEGEEEDDDAPQEPAPDDGDGSDFDELQVGRAAGCTTAGGCGRMRRQPP
jgi:hypothetical protein